MENQIIRKVTVIKQSRQWKLHKGFGTLSTELNRLPDAREVQQNQLRSAPPERTIMVF